MWAALSTQSFPSLHELTPVDRDRFVLLDTYVRACVEEWCAPGGQLSACSIVLLDDCARSITRRFRLLDGEGQHYFGRFRRLVRQILHGVDMDEVYRQARQEIDTELDEVPVFDDVLADPIV